uniref:PDZ domain-containing protein n=1 Tax=Anas platyrhynchos platyrhynchos TaxID=8840 RepID=A0A493TQR7_ANAPP
MGPFQPNPSHGFFGPVIPPRTDPLTPQLHEHTARGPPRPHGAAVGRKPPASSGAGGGGERKRRREGAGPLPGRKALLGPSTLLPGPLRCGAGGSPLPYPFGTPNFPTPQPPLHAEPPAAMPLSVTLAGPAPWGFRITGGRDFGKPITVSKVMEQGKAAAGDLRPGDVIVSINGESAAEMLNVEAQNKIKQSPGELRLQVERLPPPSPSHNGDSSPDRLATRFQDTMRMREEGSWRPPPFAPQPASPISLIPRLADGRGELGLGGHGSQSLPSAPEELPPRPSLPQPGPRTGHEALGGGLGGVQDAAGEPGAAGGPAAIQHLPPAAGGSGGRGRSRPCSPLPQPALAQRPQAGGRRPEAAHVREVRQQHRDASGEDPGGSLPAPGLLRLLRLRPQPEDAGTLLGGRRAVLREARPPALPGRPHCPHPILSPPPRHPPPQHLRGAEGTRGTPVAPLLWCFWVCNERGRVSAWLCRGVPRWHPWGRGGHWGHGGHGDA